MYQEFVVCNVPRNCITNAENSTIFYFKSISTWKEDLLRMHEKQSRRVSGFIWTLKDRLVRQASDKPIGNNLALV